MNATMVEPKKSKPIPHPVDAPTTSNARRILLLIVGLAIVMWIAQFAYHAFCYEKSDDAYVTSHVHLVNPEVGGTVVEVNAEENQIVKKGDILAKLDPSEFQNGVDKAKASVDQAEAQLIQAQAIMPYAESQVSAANAHSAQADAQAKQTAAQLTLSTANLGRAKQLFSRATGVNTQADLDAAQAAFDNAKAADNAAQANLKALEASETSAKVLLTAGPAQASSSLASVAAAKATLRDAERQLSYTTIRAPADGRIGNKNVETGNRVQIGQSLFAVVENDVWIVANFKETQIAKMHRGQNVEFVIDAVPGHVFKGRIDSFSPGTGALFTLLPPDNSTGNFTKVVQRVPVKILLEPGEQNQFKDQLRPGLSALVSVRVR